MDSSRAPFAPKALHRIRTQAEHKKTAERKRKHRRANLFRSRPPTLCEAEENQAKHKRKDQLANRF